jgi:hypothetical protein
MLTFYRCQTKIKFISTINFNLVTGNDSEASACSLMMLFEKYGINFAISRAKTGEDGKKNTDS